MAREIEVVHLKEFKSKDRSYLPLIIFTAVSSIFNIYDEDYFLSFFLIVMTSIGVAFYLNNKSRFLIFCDQIVISNKNSCRVFKFLEINKIYFKNGFLGPYICIENKNGNKCSLIFYEFDYLEIGEALFKINEDIIDNKSLLKNRINCQILKVKEDNSKKKILFHTFFPLILLIPLFILVSIGHVIFMKYFTETNYFLNYFIDDWEMNVSMILVCSMLLSSIIMIIATVRLEYLEYKYSVNNQAAYLSGYKNLLGHMSYFCYLVPISFILMSIVFHLGSSNYIAPAPFTKTEFIKDQNTIAIIDMRYICKSCRYSISKGHIVYYYNSIGEIKAGVAALQISGKSSMGRGVASHESSIEVYVDKNMTLENVELNRILGVAKTKDRKDIFFDF